VNKLAVLKFGKGSFAAGFPVLLQMGAEDALPSTEVTGELPADLDLPLQFNHWQTIYRSLDLSGRPKGLPKPIQPATAVECQQVAEQLRDRLNHWLRSDSFRPIREKCLENFHPKDAIRLILQTEDMQLQKLPWHLWELLERYPRAEIALSIPHYERRGNRAIASHQVKVLAILGDSSGIDLNSDRQTLQQTPQAAVQFMVEPARQQLNDQLWEGDWHILFFAGHSASEPGGQHGRFYINANESLTIQQIKYALKKAVDRGLQLAIFNSCDGLGLAREFADLNIPQLIVMREPVPDRIAQLFLKYFLEAFARGESLYLSVREARERLQSMEGEFPCATWLPVIYQNPAEIPPTWQDLVEPVQQVTLGANSIPPAIDADRPLDLAPPLVQSPKFNWFNVAKAIAGSLAIAATCISLRYFGKLQALELQSYDQLVRLRSPEPPDSRILIVTITEADVQQQAQEFRRGSLSDQSLSKLLQKLNVHQPSLIGLDIYRDYPVSNNSPQLNQRLIQQLAQNNNFVAVCKVDDTGSEQSGIAPPPEIPGDRVGFSDILVDEDGIVRRHLLAMAPQPPSACLSEYAFSTQIALRYLATKNIEVQFTKTGAWQLGRQLLLPIEAHTGGYQGIDALGNQILLQYRVPTSPNQIASQVTLSDVLNDRVEGQVIKDRIILIGTTAPSFQDYVLTPYSLNQTRRQEIPGVVLQAQMVSHLISMALDGRSPLWTWRMEQEMGWIVVWSMLGGLVGVTLRRFSSWMAVNGGAIAILYGSCLIVLVQWGGWIPLVPSAIVFMGSSTVVYMMFSSRLTQYTGLSTIN
jgi:CHASE2 domain-containing sensor protein